MAKTLKTVDAVVIGVGLSGSILARELTEAGLQVVGLERGVGRNTVPDFQAPAMHDELKYSVRKGLMQSAHKDIFASHFFFLLLGFVFLLSRLPFLIPLSYSFS